MVCETDRHSSHHHQGMPEENPAELQEECWVSSRMSSTWSFLALVGFSLPLRVMSALKEISEIPPSKRRELVRVQGGGTQPDPNGQSFPQDTLCTKTSLPPLQRRHRFKDTPASPKKSEIPTAELEFILILLWRVGRTRAVMPTRSCMFSHPHGFQKESQSPQMGCLV